MDYCVLLSRAHETYPLFQSPTVQCLLPRSRRSHIHVPYLLQISLTPNSACVSCSARKLGAVMGTTPYLTEADVPITLLPIGSNKRSVTGKVLKRQGSIFMYYHRDSPSITSFSSASTTSFHSLSASLVSLPSNMRSGVLSDTTWAAHARQKVSR